ncbi:Serine/threonine-protein kinase RIO3 [Orchesella cincta]|uniref:non-specific serine/threonine protein kinase n=1 Tax=Orchesella cincta TaxID=48709 RepID=A0A1D2NCT2_ORCCI|nr:Serine/threonine-protein kinase RIO3 [Orchesella cincta]
MPHSLLSPTCYIILKEELEPGSAKKSRRYNIYVELLSKDMASSSNVGFVSSPWGKLPRSPVQSTKSSQLDVSFRDIMDEQQRESSQERDFDEYIQNSYVTVMTPPPSSSASTTSGMEDETPEVERSFLQLEDLDTDLKLVMSFYEDQDFDDASYEISEQDLDELEDDESEKYYEGLAKKLSTVVELQTGSGKGNKGSRTKNSASLPADNVRLASPSVDNFVDTKSKVMLDKLRQKGILKGALKPIHVDNSFTVFHATGGMLKRRDGTSLLNAPLSSSTCSLLKLRLPKECYVKVFKNDKTETTTPMEDEQRIINAKKEVAHLNRMTRAGIPCPQVQFLLGYILITDFLGKDGSPAKKLKEAHDLLNSRSALKSAYEQITNNIKTLFKTCHLVLEDLSDSNIVWYKRQAYFVNPFNALNSNRVEALELLYHECVAITEFFGKKGKADCRTPQELFHWITGFDFTGQHVDYNSEQDFAIV